MPQRSLLKPIEEARQLLKKQIERGQELLEREINDEAGLELYKRDRLRYTQYNIEMLKSIFGEDEDAFWRYEISSPERGADAYTQLEFYREWDNKQVNELQGLEESLDLIPEGSRQPRPSHSDPAAEPLMTRKTWNQSLEDHPLAYAISLVVITATITAGIMTWAYGVRIDNLTSKYEAETSNTKAQYESKIRELEAKIGELKSKTQPTPSR
jgi:hypothetical protein